MLRLPLAVSGAVLAAVLGPPWAPAPGRPPIEPPRSTQAASRPPVEPSRSTQAPPRPPAPAADPGPELTPEQEARVQGLEGRLKCPVCRTQSLLESGSFMAVEMRARVRELVAEGRTDREVLDYFVERYGDYILLEPRKRGFGLSAYALPALAVLAGAGSILLAIRRSRLTEGPPELAESEAAPPAASEADLARVESELRRYTV